MSERARSCAADSRSGRRFLALVRRTVYAQPESPYRKLLEIAGCDYEDLGRLVTKDGLDEALGPVLGGVYLTVEEFKDAGRPSAAA